jgi:hypothetical protein
MIFFVNPHSLRSEMYLTQSLIHRGREKGEECLYFYFDTVCWTSHGNEVTVKTKFIADPWILSSFKNLCRFIHMRRVSDIAACPAVWLEQWYSTFFLAYPQIYFH